MSHLGPFQIFDRLKTANFSRIKVGRAMVVCFQPLKYLKWPKMTKKEIPVFFAISHMTNHAGPWRCKCKMVFQIVTRGICNLVLKYHNLIINCVTRCAVLYFFAHRATQFIFVLPKFSSVYAILVPGYKCRRWQFETPGYTRTVRRRGPAWSVICKDPKYELKKVGD